MFVRIAVVGGIVAVFLAVSLLPGFSNELAAPSVRPPSTPAAPSFRLREGTQFIDKAGRFKLLGDQVIFEPSDGSARFGGLENLQLERIVRVLNENPQPPEWLVSGNITEYTGANYLLVTRATLRTKLPK